MAASPEGAMILAAGGPPAGALGARDLPGLAAPFPAAPSLKDRREHAGCERRQPESLLSWSHRI